ncbi:MAG: SMC family ATPase [Sulfurimonadaceae bacterium]|jgi:exonuclease SbcC|nr:SMC family ATPase [Sulfurimonadaceae bacterium]
MMILSRLELTNFKRYRSFLLELEEGLIGIIGKNGSGKSTLFEAILFALYGELKNRGSKDTVRNSDAGEKENVSVTLTFLIENTTYSVTREFRGKTLSAYASLSKNEEVIATGAKEVTQIISKLTKMGREAFLHTLFASQKELASLGTLKNEDRKKMIRKLLGLAKIDFIETLLVEKARDLRRDIQAFSQVVLSEENRKVKQEEITKYTAQKDLFSKEIEIKQKELELEKAKELSLKKELEDFRKTKELKQKLAAEIELAKNSEKNNQLNQERLSKELSLLELKAKELQPLEAVKESYENLANTLKEQEKLKEFHLRKEGLEKEQTQLREQYLRSKKTLGMLQEESQKENPLQIELTQIVQSLHTCHESLEAKEKQIQSIQAIISAEQNQIKLTEEKITKIQELGSNSPCPTCTRVLLEEYDNVLASLRDTITKNHSLKIAEKTIKLTSLLEQKKQLLEQKKSYENIHLELSKALSIIQSKKQDLLKEEETFRRCEIQGKANKEELEKLQNYVYNPEIHQKFIQEYQKQKPLYEQFLALQTELKRVKPLQKELIQTKETHKQLRITCQEKESAFTLVLYDAQKDTLTLKAHEDILKSIEQITTDIHTQKIQNAQIEGEIKSLELVLNNDATQQKTLSLKQNDLVEYEKIKLSLVGFKNKLNSKVAPRISHLASNMYAQITKGRYQHIEVSNEFEFFIYDEGKKYPLERFSGGEIDLANLVLRIAISQTLSELNGTSNLGFLAFDEVFGSQDESRRMEILEAFHTIKEQYRQIFLISHESEIKEMFEKVIELS